MQSRPRLHRALLSVGASLLSMLLLPVLCIALFGWNWLRSPLERVTLKQTGRVLALQGDLKVSLAWPAVRLSAAQVVFANPAWAAEPRMLSADGVTVTVDGRSNPIKAHAQVRALVFDTQVTSPLALRSPIYVQGSFGQPQVSVDKGRVATRAAGAVALASVNPLLALIPLIDPGPGVDSDCRQLVHHAKARPNALQSAHPP